MSILFFILINAIAQHSAQLRTQFRLSPVNAHTLRTRKSAPVRTCALRRVQLAARVCVCVSISTHLELLKISMCAIILDKRRSLFR